MNTQRPLAYRWIIGAGAVLMLMAWPLNAAWGGRAAESNSAAESNPVPVAQATPLALEHMYLGGVKLNWVAPGVYSDTLTAPTGTLPSLGGIDLAFLLHCSANQLSGYVDLENTLVFTVEHIITTTQALTTSVQVGPAVSGTCEGATMQFESERFSLATEEGQPMLRQFSVTGTQATATTFTGEYRETLWGYGPQPLTVVGDVTLELVSGVTEAVQHQLYLPLVSR